MKPTKPITGEQIERHAREISIRNAAVNEAIVWLAMNHQDVKPECLAGEMGRHFFPPMQVSR